MEQKWIAYLLPLLVLYDGNKTCAMSNSLKLTIYSKFSDPLFPLIFLVNTPIPGIIDAVFQATFLCCLLLFWLCVYHGIRQVTVVTLLTLLSLLIVLTFLNTCYRVCENFRNFTYPNSFWSVAYGWPLLHYQLGTDTILREI